MSFPAIEKFGCLGGAVIDNLPVTQVQRGNGTHIFIPEAEIPQRKVFRHPILCIDLGMTTTPR